MNSQHWDYIYCYPDSEVLENKLNIRDQSELRIAERKITGNKILMLQDKPIKGNFDLKHLQGIHKFIFSDIYEWAGKLRTVNISKGDMFYRFDYLEDAANGLFLKLKNEHYLIGNSPDEVSKRLAYYLGEINVIHPFREGNGRTQRVFIEYLAKAAGYDIDLSTVTQDEMINASISSFDCDYEPMERMFARITKPISFVEQFSFIKMVAPPRSCVGESFQKYGCIVDSVTDEQFERLKKSKISFVSKKNKDNIFIMASFKDKDTVQKIIQSPPEIKKGRKR